MPAPSPSPIPEIEWRSRDTEIVVAVFRTVFLLIVMFSPQFLRARGVTGSLFATAVILGAAYNLALFLIHIRGWHYPRVLIVFVDLVLVTLWVYFCGPNCDRFFALYYAIVIVAGLWFGVSGALLSALLASGLYLLAVLSTPIPPGAARVPMNTVLLQIAILILTSGVVSFAFEMHERERLALVRGRAEFRRYEERIRIAQRVEDLVRPRRLPATPGLDIAFRFRPAATAESGDYYDVIPLGGRRWGICVADVRGKHSLGVIYLPTFKSALRFAARHQESPAMVLTDVNNLVGAEVTERIDVETFISLCYAVVDLDSGRLTYANAGHEPGVLLPASGADPVPLTPTGMVLGVVPDASYEERELPLHSGDAIVLFTDGMSEVSDQRGRFLGWDGLVEEIRRAADTPTAESMAGRVFDYVNEYGRLGRRRDDMTLLVVRISAPGVGTGPPAAGA